MLNSSFAYTAAPGGATSNGYQEIRDWFDRRALLEAPQLAVLNCPASALASASSSQPHATEFEAKAASSDAPDSGDADAQHYPANAPARRREPGGGEDRAERPQVDPETQTLLLLAAR